MMVNNDGLKIYERLFEWIEPCCTSLRRYISLKVNLVLRPTCNYGPLVFERIPFTIVCLTVLQAVTPNLLVHVSNETCLDRSFNLEKPFFHCWKISLTIHMYWTFLVIPPVWGNLNFLTSREDFPPRFHIYAAIKPQSTGGVGEGVSTIRTQIPISGRLHAL